MIGKNDLRACPLAQCGGEALLVFAATGGAYIECQNCGLTTRVVDDEHSDEENAKLVAALWNTRSSGWEDQVEPLAERLDRAATAASVFRQCKQSIPSMSASAFDAEIGAIQGALDAALEFVDNLAKPLPSIGEGK